MKTFWKATVLWALVCVGLWYMFHSMRPTAESVSGRVVTAMVYDGWNVDLGEQEVTLRAADDQYFEFSGNNQTLRGMPQDPPLGFGHETYFSLEEKVSGRFSLVQGDSVSLQVLGTDGQEVVVSTTPSQAAKADYMVRDILSTVAIFIAAGVWFYILWKLV